MNSQITVLPDPKELAALESSISLSMQEVEKEASLIKKEADELLSVKDDDIFMEKSSDLDFKMNAYLVKCRTYANYINEQRCVFTSRFDSIKSYFTAIENELKGTSSGVGVDIIWARKNLLKRISDIQEFRKQIREEKLATEKERVALKKTFPRAIANYIEFLVSDSQAKFLSYVNSGVEPKEAFSLSTPSMDLHEFFLYFPLKLQYLDKDELWNIINDWYNEEGVAIIDEILPKALSTFRKIALELYYKSKGKKDTVDALIDKLEIEKKEAHNTFEGETEKILDENIIIASITTELDTPSLPDFSGNICKNIVVNVTKQSGYATLFAQWFNAVGKDMDIDKLDKFKLSSLKVWAAKNHKATGEKIISDGIVYSEEIKQIVRA